MLGRIPNPKKQLQINKPEEEIRQALFYLKALSEKYRLTGSDDVLKQYTFETTEFLSLGVYIDINYSSVDAEKTDITIEVRRKVGTFDKAHEISLAQTHIKEISDLISRSLTSDQTDRQAKYDEVQQKEASLQNSISERKRKQEEKKRDRPVAYYFEQFVGTLIVAAVLGGLGWIVMKIFF